MNPTSNQRSAAADRYISVTPAGCYYAVENRDPTIARQILHRILSVPVSPALSQFSKTDIDSILELLKSELVMLTDQPITLPEGNLTKLLPHVLSALSEQGRVVLTESGQGLFIDYSGISQDEAEELAVMAAGFRVLAEKRTRLLAKQLSISSRAFGVVDPAGNSEIGFWPLYISDNVFTLIVLGIPRFNTAQFCTLVWALVERYGEHENDDARDF